MKNTRNTPAARFSDIPGSLPNGQVPKDANHAAVAKLAVEQLNDLQKDHLAPNVIWRDLLAFTGTYRTFYGVDLVFDTLQKLSREKDRSKFVLSNHAPRLVPLPAAGWINVDVTFDVQEESLRGQCAGTISLTSDDNGQWKVWMIRTWLENYDGHGHPDVLDASTTNGYVKATRSTDGVHEHVYDVLIAGGGQGGLGLAGRLQALHVDYLLFDKHPSLGDSWAHRYDSLKWHTVKEYGNLPFGRTFSEHDENLLPAKKIGQGFRAWAEKHSINAQSATTVDSADWDESSQTWTVHTSGTFGAEKWKCRNLVLCVGFQLGLPVAPQWATPEKIKASGFKGTITHSAYYHNCKAFAGQHGIVVGTGNTGHDIAEDMANVHMDTTMIQRNSTFVLPGEWLEAAQNHQYNLAQPTEEVDRDAATAPNKIQREMMNGMVWSMIKGHPERFDALEKAGFKVDRYADIYNILYSRYGGHYVDIGASARIVNGEIKIKSGLVERLTEDGVMFEDGSDLKADLIVLCTGFDHDPRRDAANIVGQDMADQMEEFGGVDSEGELRAYAKVAGHPHLFYGGGEARLARFFSRFLALQLQKMTLGFPLRPYQDGD